MFYGGIRNTNIKSKDSIIKRINNIFASPNHVYKSNVRIIFKDKEETKILVGKTNTHLITKNGELIKITDILDIEKL